MLRTTGQAHTDFQHAITSGMKITGALIPMPRTDLVFHILIKFPAYLNSYTVKVCQKAFSYLKQSGKLLSCTSKGSTPATYNYKRYTFIRARLRYQREDTATTKRPEMRQQFQCGIMIYQSIVPSSCLRRRNFFDHNARY